MKFLIDHYGARNPAFRYWEAAATAGNAFAACGLGTAFKDDGNTAQAIRWWSKGVALAFIPEAAYNLGVVHGLGPSIPFEKYHHTVYGTFALPSLIPDVP